MSNSTLYPVVSVEGTHFTEALAGAVNGVFTPPFSASAMNNIPGVPAISSRRFIIRALKLVTKENFGPEVNLFGKAAALGTDPQADSFVARFQFASVNGEQIGGTGLYRYYIDGLAIPYFDEDAANTVGVGSLHVILQNVDVTAKSAGVPGYVKLTVYLEPVQSF